MEKVVICGSCGAEFDKNIVKCPYCGSTNIKGAEREYMEKLEDVREGMGELESVPLEELQDTVKRQGRFLKKVIISILAVAATAVLIVVVVNRSDKNDYKAEYLWQQEYFPQLSALYDSGEYDAMLELAHQALAGTQFTLWDWEHYDFYEAYSIAVDFDELHRQRAAGTIYDYNYSTLFFCEWSLVCFEEFAQEREAQLQIIYTEQEWSVLEPYIEIAREDLAANWGMSEEEYQEYLQLAADNYWKVPYDRCEEYVKNWQKK